ncbi:hypothetical protein P12x_003025 [Tundrisphaera lichenicola]|uniref:hypothetical protein n=1 Tax=Tundrisphaera lichenicola TaxID=2029860 RepID=UPI003EBDC465
MPAASETAIENGTKNTPPDEQARRIEIDPEGYRYDADTGEVLGHQDEAPFTICTAEGVDWVLGLMMTEQLRIRAIEARRAAMNANLDAMLVDPTNRLRWIDYRFRAEIEAQARKDIEQAGGRSRTAKYPHGKVAFRMSAGSSQVTDPGQALEFVKDVAPEQLDYKTPTIAAINAAVEAYAQQMGEEPDVTPFFRKAEPRETCQIETGLGKESRK